MRTGALRLLQVARIAPPSIKINISLGQARPSRSKLRIYLNRSREHLPRKLDVLTSPRLEKLTPTQIKFVSLNIRRGWYKKPTFPPRGEEKPQGVENAACYLILNGKDALDL